MRQAVAQASLGGFGFVKESILPRLYRDALLNSIWEGSGNIQCLDVVRALVRAPDAVEAFFAEVREASGDDVRLRALTRRLQQSLAHPERIEYSARRVVEAMAVAIEAALLIRAGDSAVADAFCRSRIERDGGLTYGTLDEGARCGEILERARPQVEGTDAVGQASIRASASA